MIFQDQNSDTPYFDDCPVCQAMKKAEEEGRELSYEELKKAFKEANELGGIIVGDEVGE